MKRNLRIFCISLLWIAFLATVTACVSMKPKTRKPDPALAGQYLTQAQTYEANGDLPAALEQYKLALTVDPENARARESQARLTQTLAKLADERYKLGMKYHRQGKYGLARKEFLIALKYNPDHEKASKMLVSREPSKTPRYVFHIVRPGESLSQIAKDYYGDFRKYDVIARFNNLEDATRVKPGQRIMIPEYDGVVLPTTPVRSDREDGSFVWHTIQPGQSISQLAKLYYGDYTLFHAIAQYNGMEDATRVSVGQKIKIPKLSHVPFHPPAEPSKPEPSVDAAEPTLAEPAVGSSAGLVELGVEPVTEPEPVIEDGVEEEPYFETGPGTPNGEEQIMAYRDAGIALFNQGKYEDAVFELNKAIEATPDDGSTRRYLAKAYFETGKQLFHQQDFKAAQESFESSLQYDPQCNECRGYIDRSKMGPILAHRTRGIALFQKKEYGAAIDEFMQFLQERPQDEEIRGYTATAFFEHGVMTYKKGEFEAAKKDFETALAYNPDCAQCNDYINRSVNSYKESHYNRGIIFFGKEQLPMAIAEWKKVYEIDPDYKDVEQNLKKAQTLLDKLEQIKKSQ